VYIGLPLPEVAPPPPQEERRPVAARLTTRKNFEKLLFCILRLSDKKSFKERGAFQKSVSMCLLFSK
jgi:hypothetical protein